MLWSFASEVWVTFLADVFGLGILSLVGSSPHQFVELLAIEYGLLAFLPQLQGELVVLLRSNITVVSLLRSSDDRRSGGWCRFLFLCSDLCEPQGSFWEWLFRLWKQSVNPFNLLSNLFGQSRGLGKLRNNFLFFLITPSQSCGVPSLVWSS